MKNEKGITLIELLAAVTILLIISSLIYGVLIGANKNYRQISGKMNLEQKANTIITTFRSYHQKNTTYLVSYDSTNKKAYIGTTAANIPLGSSSVQMILKLGYPDYADFSGVKSIDCTKPINLYLKLTDNQGQSYEIDTIINRY